MAGFILCHEQGSLSQCSGWAVPDSGSLVFLDLKDEPPLTLKVASAKGDLQMSYKSVLNFYLLLQH